DQVGLKKVVDRIVEFGEKLGKDYWEPAPLMVRLANEGKTFADWAKESARDNNSPGRLKMISYQTATLGAPLQRSESATLVPEGTEVLVKMVACGVCHSDIHLHDGEVN